MTEVIQQLYEQMQRASVDAEAQAAAAKTAEVRSLACHQMRIYHDTWLQTEEAGEERGPPREETSQAGCGCGAQAQL